MLSPIQVQPQLHLTSYVVKAVALRGCSEYSFWSGPKQVSGQMPEAESRFELAVQAGSALSNFSS